VESARLRDVDGVHGLVREAENLRTFKSDDLARQFLLRSWHFTGLDEELVFACVSKHVFEL